MLSRTLIRSSLKYNSKLASNSLRATTRNFSQTQSWSKSILIPESSPNNITYSEAPFLYKTAQQALSDPEVIEALSKKNSAESSPDPTEVNVGSATKLNLYQAINDALRIALDTHPNAILFGEDVAFGGVFRCSMGLQEMFGAHRVFNTPLTEQGIVGFGVGYAATSPTMFDDYDTSTGNEEVDRCIAIAEIQFSDYVFPAFDQIVNEAAKYRYRGADHFNVGGLTIRMPCGNVGHGAMYHSQSGEAFFAHSPGIKVVMPRSPLQAKGLLLSAIRDKNPVIFMEPKMLYRASVEYVPNEDYELPLGKAQVVQEGSDVTIVTYGTPVYIAVKAAELAAQELKNKDGSKVSVEVIDLRTVHPWDRETVVNSVNKTGRAIVLHEAPKTNSISSDVAAEILQRCFLRLESPIERVTGWDVHMPLQFEDLIAPNVTRVFHAIKKTINY